MENFRLSGHSLGLSKSAFGSSKEIRSRNLNCFGWNTPARDIEDAKSNQSGISWHLFTVPTKMNSFKRRACMRLPHTTVFILQELVHENPARSCHKTSAEKAREEGENFNSSSVFASTAAGLWQASRRAWAR